MIRVIMVIRVTVLGSLGLLGLLELLLLILHWSHGPYAVEQLLPRFALGLGVIIKIRVMRVLRTCVRTS